MTKDKIIAAARECELLEPRDVPPTIPREYLLALERFYAIAYRAGMERAAEICERMRSDTPIGMSQRTQALYYAVDAIRAEAHAKNQPESTHDNGNV